MKEFSMANQACLSLPITTIMAVLVIGPTYGAPHLVGGFKHVLFSISYMG
jgi:hypothetical protein